MTLVSFGQRIATIFASIGVLACIGFMASWVFVARPPASPPPPPMPTATPEKNAISNAPAATTLPAENTAPAPPAPTIAPAERMTNAERRAFELERDNVRLRARLEDMLNWILDNIKGKYPLSEKLMANLKIDPLTDDLYVSTDLAELLRLSEAETHRLDEVFLDSRAALYELESAGISVKQMDENGIMLEIPAFDGAAIRTNLYEQLALTLGNPRFNRFLQVAGEALENRYGHFGEMVRTLLLSPFENENGEPQWFIRDEQSVPGDDGMSRDTTVSEKVVTELPLEYEVYEPWLTEPAPAEEGK